MTRTWDGAFSWRLFDPGARPSYFHASSGVWTGDPSDWEIAALLVFACCAAVLFVIVQRRLCRRSLAFALVVCPAAVGALGTIIQIHQAFIGIGREWIGPAALFDDFIYYSLYSTHLGGYGTILLAVVFGPLYWSRCGPPKVI